jgi:hypothetical protein
VEYITNILEVNKLLNRKLKLENELLRLKSQSSIIMRDILNINLNLI